MCISDDLVILYIVVAVAVASAGSGRFEHACLVFVVLASNAFFVRVWICQGYILRFTLAACAHEPAKVAGDDGKFEDDTKRGESTLI